MRRGSRTFPGSLGAAAIALQLLATPASAETLQLRTMDGPREAIVVAAPVRPAPTIIVLHGATATAAHTVRTSGFAEAASARGFASVFPQGLGRQWNDGREKGTAVAYVDDVAFVRTLVEELVARRIAIAGRIYVAGISNGGMMTFRLLCEASDMFAGAATIIASMPVRSGAHCRPSRAVPLVMFNGTSDPLVPYSGGRVGFRGMRGEVWAAEDTARFFARIGGCIASREVGVEAKAGVAAVTRIEWGRCRGVAGVGLFRLQGAGHQVPGGGTFLPRLLGANTPGLSAAETALDLFAAQSRWSLPSTPEVEPIPPTRAD